MIGGRLEHEIRLLPQVLACSTTPDAVVVLIEPSADPIAVERRVAEIVRARGDRGLAVRVVGGTERRPAGPARARPGRSLLLGTAGGAAALALGVWIAGTGAGFRAPGAREGAAVGALAPPVARSVVSVPSVLSVKIRHPAGPGAEVAPSTGLLGPVGRPTLGAGPSVLGPRPAAGAPAECRPPDRGPPRERPGLHRGSGPRSWSRAALVPPHDDCARGRPR